MKLKSLSYRENISKDNLNPWELKELLLDDYNLIVGKNATGKTRITNILHHLAIQIRTPVSYNGEWKAKYVDVAGNHFEFLVCWDDGKIVNESITVNDEKKLKRTLNSAEIYSEVTKSWHSISPPNDRLVLHVRRDKNEFPFLETLFKWAIGVRGFSFSNTSPNVIELPGNSFQLASLNAVPSALEILSEEELKVVLKQLETVGYHLEGAIIKPIPGRPPTDKMILFKEQGISNLLKQFEIAQGMYRAFALLTILHYLRLHEDVSMVLVDDLGEGLDFERASNLAKVVFNKSKIDFQFIATSNDSSLINSIPLKELTVCYRKEHVVECLNYSNAKEKFDSWKELGLNNFDLLSTNYLLSK